MARLADNRWFQLVRDYQSKPIVATFISMLQNDSILDAQLKDFCGKNITEMLNG